AGGWPRVHPAGRALRRGLEGPLQAHRPRRAAQGRPSAPALHAAGGSSQTEEVNGRRMLRASRAALPALVACALLAGCATRPSGALDETVTVSAASPVQVGREPLSLQIVA